jgi:G3E family GTPase
MAATDRMVPTYVMIGGFLGAGKTTAILELARDLSSRGRRVGVIMNDQSTGLVDTALAGARGFNVEEVSGGCFCCRFNSLVEAAERLSADLVPDVFLAEPVGSCTDLKATVSYPLRRLYGSRYAVAPLSVVVDPVRALRVLGVEAGRSFSPKVRYVYVKQLEEADLIVLNKRDLVSGARWSSLRAAVAERFPSAEIFEISAREGSGLEPWFDRMLTSRAERTAPPELDYRRYGEGEALLGWLNATIRVAGASVDGNRLLLELAGDVQRRLAGDGVEVAHLKATLAADELGTDLAVVNLVATERVPELAHALAEPIESGELVLNLRAEAEPERLRRRIMEVVESGPWRSAGASACRLVHLECFSPPQPVPTHRLAG